MVNNKLCVILKDVHRQMKIIKLIFIMVGLFICLTGCKEPTDKRDFQDDKFKVGQMWKYNTRTGEENSTLTILKVEKYDSAGPVIHIYVNGLKLKNTRLRSGFSDDIGHLPLSKEAVLKSVTTLVSEDNNLPDFKEGYNNWKEAFDNGEAGIFTITVKESIDVTEQTINQGTRTN